MEVPCNGCTRCCKGDAVRILETEDPRNWKTEVHPIFISKLMLAHKPNRDCRYLGSNGCTIHETKPQMCKDMDCRNIARAYTFTQARKLAAKNMLRFPVWKRGRELLSGNVVPL